MARLTRMNCNNIVNENFMKTACFILARTDSSRLPGKALIPVRGKKVIEHVIDRAKLVRKADLVVLCTTSRSEDDVLEKVAHQKNIKCFRGSLNNVFSRWLKAAEKFKVDYFSTFDGDDLFCEPKFMDLAISMVVNKKFDLVQGPAGLICGSSSYGISVAWLKKVCLGLADSDRMEMHQWLNMTDLNLFRIGEFKVKNPIFFNEKIRMTLDYQEDLVFFKKVFGGLKMNTNIISLLKIVRFLNKNPELAKINLFRQSHYLSNQIKKLKQVKEERINKYGQI